ncbi:MAG: hypothetical protein QG635_142 [Bacteroidota bacterium]|nr:hypothetical protein [Bacteroidota bacterium]
MQEEYYDPDELDDAFDDEDLLVNKYLAFDLAGVKYAIRLETVKEIILMPQIIAKPSRKDYEKGLIKLRNSTLTLYDLRKRFGLPSFIDEDKELIDMLKQREQEHINWINELTSSVVENRDFKLATNPHDCAFGRWYDNFKPDNINMSLFFSQFDMPHRRIHAIAGKCLKLSREGNSSRAEEIITASKDTDLKSLIELFHEAPHNIKESRREIAVIIEYENVQKALSIDKADKIVEITKDNIRDPDESEMTVFINGIASIDNDVYILLDESKLLDYIV